MSEKEKETIEEAKEQCNKAYSELRSFAQEHYKNLSETNEGRVYKVMARLAIVYEKLFSVTELTEESEDRNNSGKVIYLNDYRIKRSVAK